MGKAYQTLLQYRNSLVAQMDATSQQLAQMREKMVKGVNAQTAYRWQYSLAALEARQNQTRTVLQQLNSNLKEQHMKTFTEFLTEAATVLPFPKDRWKATPEPAKPEPAAAKPAEKKNIEATVNDVVDRMNDALMVANRIDAEEDAKRDYPWAKNLSHEQKVKQLQDVLSSRRFTYKNRQKYIAIDSDGSGRFLVDKTDGQVYGIKAYGVVHPGYQYGNIYQPDIKRLVIGALGHVMSRKAHELDYSRY